jgi:hypothetical protein
MAANRKASKSVSGGKRRGASADKVYKGIRIEEDSKKGTMVAIGDISIVERPEPGKENGKLFYNPRRSFNPERMRRLREAIQIDGLQHPLVVRAVAEDDIITAIELIAGERRLRSLQKLIELDEPCFDKDNPVYPDKYKAGEFVIFNAKVAKVEKLDGDKYVVSTVDDTGKSVKETAEWDELLPTVPASQLYSKIKVNVYYNCDDKWALRLAVTENGEHEDLTTREEVELVERLVASGCKQQEICEIMNNNVTWVSQTASFRTQLPPQAFAKLLDGKMTRNVAVSILSYPQEDRQAVYEATVKTEVAERKEALKDLQEIKEDLLDQQDLAETQAKKAKSQGDKEGESKAKKRAAVAGAKAKKVTEKQQQIKEDAGVLRQGHVQRGAAAAGKKTRKAKILPKDQIEELFIKKLQLWEKNGHVDSASGHKLPRDYVTIMRMTAQAILGGERDPAKVIRDFMVDQGNWEVSESDDDGPSDDDLEGMGGDGDDYDEEGAELEEAFGGSIEDDRDI